MPDKYKTVHVEAHDRRVKIKDKSKVDKKLDTPTYHPGQNPRPQIGKGVKIIGSTANVAKDKGVTVVKRGA